MPPRIDHLIRDLAEWIPQALEMRGVPGLAIGICDADAALWTAGFGSTRRHGGSPINPSTIFSVQSTSKMYTATAVMLGVQQSILDLDAPITAYLPEFSVKSVFETDPAKKITLRHLLSHTAGFTHEAPLGSNYVIGRGGFEAHCRSIADTWLRFPVGHHHEYSNLGIDLAGYILQRASGVSFARYLQRELFAPLGLKRSTFDLRAISAEANRAIGHWKVFEQANRPLPLKIPMVAAGGLYTSVQDALRYVQFHLRAGEQLLDAGLLSEQYRVPNPAPGQSYGYGLGVYIDEWESGVTVYHHGGAGFGFLCQLCWVPALAIGVVVLTNSFDHSLENEITRWVIKELTAGDGREVDPGPELSGVDAAEREPIDDTASVEDQDLARLVGEYIGRLGDKMDVFAENGRLCVRGAEQCGAEVVGPDTIRLENARRDRYRFTTDGSGYHTYMHRLRDGQVRYKNDPAATPPSTLDPGWQGDYRVKAWGVPLTTYRLVQAGASPAIEMATDREDPVAPRHALRLAPVAPGLYLSSMGEMLDLRPPTPTYANIRLTRIRR